MLRREKERVVEELHEAFQDVKVAILSDYRGLNVAEMTALRSRLRQASVNYRVVKNALIKLALKNTELEPLVDQISGPTAIAFSRHDPISPAKILQEFSRQQPKLEIKGGIVEGRVVDEGSIRRLADIPSRKVLLGQLVSVLGGGPVRLVTVLAFNLQRFLQVLEAIRLQKENPS